MAVVAHLNLAVGANTAVPTTLTASNSFVYERGKNQFLIISNPTGGGIACTIDGDGGSSVKVPGLGAVTVSSGYSVGTIAAGETVVIQLDSIFEYLKGTISITGTDLTAFIIN